MLLSEGLHCCCLDWQLGETRHFLNGIRVVKRSIRTRRRRAPLRPKVQAGPYHPKFQSLAFQAGVREAFAPNSPRAGGMRYWMLAPCRVSWEASIGPHVSGPAKFLNCLTGTDANARDLRAASTLGCVRQGLCFQLFEMEFMVNAN